MPFEGGQLLGRRAVDGPPRLVQVLLHGHRLGGELDPAFGNVDPPPEQGVQLHATSRALLGQQRTAAEDLEIRAQRDQQR